MTLRPSEERKVSVQELLDLLPAGYLSELSAELNVDKWVKKLSPATLFYLVIFSILESERLSLRVMASNVSHPFLKSLVPVLAADEVTYVAIREKLCQLKPTYFSRIYEHF